jgi:hypothetical protein
MLSQINKLMTTFRWSIKCAIAWIVSYTIVLHFGFVLIETVRALKFMLGRAIPDGLRLRSPDAMFDMVVVASFSLSHDLHLGKNSLPQRLIDQGGSR